MAAEPTLRYRALATHLPAIYREDPASFDQVSSFLGLVDSMSMLLLGGLRDGLAWLGPEAHRIAPPGLLAGEDGSESVNRVLALYDEAASWLGFQFPESWRVTPPASTPAEDLREAELTAGLAELARKRTFLARAPRLWRRRGTPRGFLDWFCTAFALTELAGRPVMLEHFKLRRPRNAPASDDPFSHHVTMLAAQEEPFTSLDRRQEALQFVARQAPAHLVVRLCFVARPTLDEVRGKLATAAGTGPDATNAKNWLREHALHRIGDFVKHGDAIRAPKCANEGRNLDHLSLGRLPGHTDRS